MAEWFAERADLILLLFDAHKLDISDELKRVIEVLRPHDDKVRVILNKADAVSEQELMRVYGALMWSLGKVINTPEVMRVYCGSFHPNRQASSASSPPKSSISGAMSPSPTKDDANSASFLSSSSKGSTPEDYKRALLAHEEADLLAELAALPRNAIIRKINDVVKRARLAKVHAYIVSHLRAQMPTLWSKSSKQRKILDNLATEFSNIHRQHNLPIGDFPDIVKFREKLEEWGDLSNFPKLSTRMLKEVDDALSRDLPALMQQFPQLDSKMTRALALSRSTSGMSQRGENTLLREIFLEHAHMDRITGSKARDLFLAHTPLPQEELAVIWRIADVDEDGALTEAEFYTAMHLIKTRMAGCPLPEVNASTPNINTSKTTPVMPQQTAQMETSDAKTIE